MQQNQKYLFLFHSFFLFKTWHQHYRTIPTMQLGRQQFGLCYAISGQCNYELLASSRDKKRTAEVS